ncbi:GNAT family N-acetyltransferase [Solibacillus sp. FSL H8-0538]|uniref:GNAT family N-acetyltransferase n=1 Tax=Solibacillus sp. FSL H8-0538 TaxID=2921400 RepID=UPI0030F8294F
MTIKIRKMHIDDIKAVQHIAEVSWNRTYDGIIPLTVQNIFLAVAYSEEMLMKRLKMTPFFVVEEHGELIGFANFSPVKENGEIELSAIYILPEAQHKGVGTQLLTYGLANLKPNRICLNVESENTIGKNFYYAKGFKFIEEFDEDFNGYRLKTTRMALEI